jgi:hypothetical protein
MYIYIGVSLSWKSNKFAFALQYDNALIANCLQNITYKVQLYKEHFTSKYSPYTAHDKLDSKTLSTLILSYIPISILIHEPFVSGRLDFILFFLLSRLSFTSNSIEFSSTVITSEDITFSFLWWKTMTHATQNSITNICLYIANFWGMT